MTKIPIISDSQKEQMVSAVWDLIAYEVGESLPSFVDQVIEEHFPDLLTVEFAEDMHYKISTSLGHLAYS